MTTGIALLDRPGAESWLKLLRLSALGWAVMIGLLIAIADIRIGAGLALVSLALTPFYYLARRELCGVALLSALSFFIIIYSPAFGFFRDGDYRHIANIAFVLPWLALVEWLIAGRIGLNLAQPSARPGGDLGWCLFWLAAATLLSLVDEDWSLLFLVGYGLSLFHFARLAGSGSHRWLALAGYALALAIYIFFIWDTYGRLLVGGLIAMPLLLIVGQGSWRAKPWMIFLLLPLALGLAQWVRGDELGDQGLLSGSVATPSIIAVQLLATLHLVAPRLGVFADQLMLFFLAWVPRSIWPEKPLGLGSTLVDDLYGRRGTSLEHSIAPGVLGEALWSFGPYFLLGLLAVALVYVLLTFLQRALLRESAAIAAIQLCLLPTLVWGGMASFSARYWLFALPLFAYALAWRLVSARGGR